jgi:hypothetical protein
MAAVGTLQPSVEKLYDAALLGDGWNDALETLSRAGGSRGALGSQIARQHHERGYP